MSCKASLTSLLMIMVVVMLDDDAVMNVLM